MPTLIAKYLQVKLVIEFIYLLSNLDWLKIFQHSFRLLFMLCVLDVVGRTGSRDTAICASHVEAYLIPTCAYVLIAAALINICKKQKWPMKKRVPVKNILKFGQKAIFENKPLLTVDSPIPSSTIYSSVGKNHLEVVFLHLKFITLNWVYWIKQ